jgi:hypothetical protein
MRNELQALKADLLHYVALFGGLGQELIQVRGLAGADAVICRPLEALLRGCG